MTSTIYAIAFAKEAIEKKVGETAMLPANDLQVLLGRIAELEDVLRASMDELNGVLSGKYSGNAYQAITKIKEVLGDE